VLLLLAAAGLLGTAVNWKLLDSSAVGVLLLPPPMASRCRWRLATSRGLLPLGGVLPNSLLVSEVGVPDRGLPLLGGVPNTCSATAAAQQHNAKLQVLVVATATLE
jgi:hypothetical protein